MADHLKFKSGSTDSSSNSEQIITPCGRCHESQDLELQARSIILTGCTKGATKFTKHYCCCIIQQSPSSDSDLFSRSKRARTSSNGRFVPANDLPKTVVASSTSPPPSVVTTTTTTTTTTTATLVTKVDESESSLIPGLGDDEARLCLARLPRSCYGDFFTVSKRFRSLLRSGELYRTRRALGIWEQWVYVLISGQPVWRAFSISDPMGLRWRPLPQTPWDPCFFLGDKESLTAGTQLLVVGREASGHCIWGYDLISDGWFRAPEMLTPRCLYASASCESHAFVAGGIDTKSRSELRSAERYDSVSGRWEALPEMISPRKMCSGFYMDGKFYVVGGVCTDAGGKETGLSCGEEFDPETGRWRRIPDMWPLRSGESNTSAPPLVAVVGNEVYSLDTTSRRLMKYCKKGNRWSEVGDVPVKPDSSSGWGVAFKAVNGELLLIGGAIYACKPNGEGPVNWRLVAGLIPPGTFVFNCAVMSV